MSDDFWLIFLEKEDDERIRSGWDILGGREGRDD